MFRQKTKQEPKAKMLSLNECTDYLCQYCDDDNIPMSIYEDLYGDIDPSGKDKYNDDLYMAIILDESIHDYGELQNFEIPDYSIDAFASILWQVYRKGFQDCQKKLKD